MMWRIFLLLLCILSNLYAQGELKPIAKYSIAVKFDLLMDEDIDASDPRIRSVVYSAHTYSGSKIIINYVNPNAQKLAVLLAQIFYRQQLQVLEPMQITSSVSNDNKYVSVIIYYQG